MAIDEALQEFDAVLNRTEYDLNLYRGDVEDGGEETPEQKAAELRDSLLKLAEAATDLATALNEGEAHGP